MNELKSEPKEAHKEGEVRENKHDIVSEDDDLGENSSFKNKLEAKKTFFKEEDLGDKYFVAISNL